MHVYKILAPPHFKQLPRPLTNVQTFIISMPSLPSQNKQSVYIIHDAVLTIACIAWACGIFYNREVNHVYYIYYGILQYRVNLSGLNCFSQKLNPLKMTTFKVIVLLLCLCAVPSVKSFIHHFPNPGFRLPWFPKPEPPTKPPTKPPAFFAPVRDSKYCDESEITKILSGGKRRKRAVRKLK